MGCRPLPSVCLLAISLCLSSLDGAHAGPITHIETFLDSTHKDAVATTADWDELFGQLALNEVQLVGQTGYDTPGAAEGLDFDGKYVYVADWTSGLEIFDVQLSTPVLVGSHDTPGTAISVAVDGNHAYVADGGEGIQVVDISLPSSPALAGSLALFGTTYDVAVSGDYLIAVHRRFDLLNINRLTVVDVSDPANPSILGALSLAGEAWRVSIEGDHVYVAGGSAGMQIVSIAAPASPTLVGSYNTAGVARDVCIAGNLAYVADESNGLVILNLTNLAAPSLVTTAATANFAVGVAVDGNYVYVADASNGVVEFYVRNPSAPILLETEDTPGSAVDVLVAMPRIFVADDTGGLAIIRAALDGSLPLVGSAAMSGSAFDIAVAGDVAYIADGVNGVTSFDISEPESPTFLGNYNTAGVARALDLQGDVLYVADGSAGLVVINISNPSSPSLRGSFNTPSDASNVCVSGDYAFVADGTSLQVIDITSPSSPAFVTSVAIAAWGVDVEGNHAYVASGNAGLKVVDITNPSAPSVVGTAPAFFALDVDVTGDDCFVATGSLIWFNVSNPASPSVVETVFSSNDLVGVVAAGDYVYTANRYLTSVLDMGVQVYAKLSSSLVLVSSHEGDFNPGAVAVAGDHVFSTVMPYAFSNTDGLRVLKHLDRYLDESGDIGQSTQFANFCGSNTIAAARVIPTQTGTVFWSLNNGGLDWHPVTSGVWTSLPNSGCSLKWQSQHFYEHDGVNPTCTNLVVEMLLDTPSIDAVADIPADQGGSIQLDWTRSGYDIAGSALPITEYVVFRRSLGSPAMWDSVGVSVATQSQQYALTVLTEADSSLFSGLNYTALYIRAKTSNPFTWWDSPVDSVYSVDNLSPGAPQNFSVGYNSAGGRYNYLLWDAPPDPDVFRFNIYRSADPFFVADPVTLVAWVDNAPVSEWKDPEFSSSGVYYQVSALDAAGNEGPPASPETVTSVDGAPVSLRLALYQNTPNPFNPVTRIVYEVPNADTKLELSVFDVMGRHVRQLAAGLHDSGTFTAVWRGRDDDGTLVASGVYFYRLTVGDAQLTKKMILAK